MRAGLDADRQSRGFVLRLGSIPRAPLHASASLCRITMRLTLIASAIMLTACSPRVIERIKTVEVKVPVAAPCPLPADVVPRPAKVPFALPDDAVSALAIVTKHALAQDQWGDVVERQIAACAGVRPAQ
jgi:hypothetical protein